MDNAFTDDGVGAIGEPISVYKTNLTTFERGLLRKLRRDKRRLRNTVAPGASTPASEISPKDKLNAARAEMNGHRDVAIAKYKNAINEAEKTLKLRLRSGSNKADAQREYSIAMRAAKSERDRDMNDIRRTLRARILEIKKAKLGVKTNIASQRKFARLAKIQKLEKRISEVQDLINGNRITQAVGSARIMRLRERIAQCLSEVKQIDLNTQGAIVKSYIAMGQISPEAAKEIMRKKKQEIKKINRAYRYQKARISFEPIDKDTNRVIMPLELRRQIAYRKKIGMDTSKMEQVLKNPKRPGTRTVRVKIRLLSAAQRASPLSGEATYFNTQNQKISTARYDLVLPTRSIMPDAVPNQVYLDAVTDSNVKSVDILRRLKRHTMARKRKWLQWYNKLKAKGLENDGSVLIAVDIIKSKRETIRQAKSTGRTTDEVINALRDLMSEYTRQILVFQTKLKNTSPVTGLNDGDYTTYWRR